MSVGTILACLAVICLWGSGPIFDKAALDHLEPHQLFIARFYLLFILLLTPMVLYFDEYRKERLTE